ncbi:MAG: site-specific integrase [Clostridiales bacterium]|nr:site-specific integrase [Clostridiales bacterium]
MARKGENIYKRRDGRWEGRFIRGRKEDGTAQYSSLYGRTYTEVQEKLRQKRAEISPQLPRCPMTVKELFDLWLSARHSSVKPSSYARYVILVEKHIIPRLGKQRVDRLTAKKLREYIEWELCNGRADHKGGLSPKTVNDLVVVLKSALRLAKKKYALPEELFSEISPPAVRQRKIDTMGEQETAVFSAAALAASDLNSAAYLLSLNTGLRLGEICALKWSDVDFTESIIHVRRTVLRVKKGSGTQLSVQSPKSDASDRIVPLTEEMRDLLRLLRGSTPDDAYMLTGQREKPMEPRTMQYRFQSFLKRNGLRERNFHTLRHSFATRCISNGADPKTLSELLGHSNVKTTLQLYVHPSMQQKRAYIYAASTIIPKGQDFSA